MEIEHLKEETELKKKVAEWAAAQCTEEKTEFGQCVAGSNVITVLFCKKQMKEWNQCLQKYNTQEELEKRIAEATIHKLEKFKEESETKSA